MLLGDYLISDVLETGYGYKYELFVGNVTSVVDASLSVQ